MAIHIRDFEYEHGKSLLESLEGETGRLIRYYVSENEKYHKKTSDKLTKLHEALYILRNF
jgi:hypothetical protein